MACRHCQIEIKYSGNISNSSDNLKEALGCVSPFFRNQHFLLFPKSVLALPIEIIDINFVNYLTQMPIFFLKLLIEIVDYFIPRNKENSLLNLPGSDIPPTKLNNTSKYLG